MNTYVYFIYMYIDSGCYSNFMEEKGAEIVTKELNCPPVKHLLWEV